MKFTVAGEVRLEAGYREGWLELAVVDTGIGIPRDHIDQPFQPFHQQGREEYRRQGTGLGLAISKQLAERMGGAIRVEGRVGEGSRFAVRLPLPSLADAPPDSASTPEAPLVGYRRRDGREEPLIVLVADDIEDNRAVLRGLLIPLGFTVVEAADGEDALELTARQPPDLVLMDLVMPRLDGVAATARLLALPGLAATPVIACSASTFAEDRARATEAGCRGYIAKPIRAAELYAALARLLELEWVTEPRDAAAPMPAKSEDAPAFTQSQRDILLDLTRRGEIGTIQALLKGLADDADAVVPALRAAAARFDMKTLQRILGEADFGQP